MSKTETDTRPKRDHFNDVAEAFGFATTTEEGRKPRFRRRELTVLYDRLRDLGYITQPREGDEPRTDLRATIASALDYDPRGGSPLSVEAVKDLQEKFCGEGVVADGGSGTLDPPKAEDYPRDVDLERSEEFGHVFEWEDPESVVCVSRHRNSSRFHTLWRVRGDGELEPVCLGYSPSDQTPHRLAPRDSIARTTEKCAYCRRGDLRL